MKLRLAIVGAIGILAGIVAGVWSAQHETKPSASTGSRVVSWEGSYSTVSMQEMEKTADIIVVGKVEQISPATWNQDSGEYYEAPDAANAIFPVHDVTIRASQYLAGAETADSLTVTVIGNSPSGSTTFMSSGQVVTIGGRPDHNLQDGDQAVFFLRKTEIGWRGGRRPAIMLMGYPGHSYLKLGSDGNYHGGPDGISTGLDSVVAEIARERGS